MPWTVFIFLYASETWTLSEDPQRRRRRIQAVEMRSFREMKRRISYKDHMLSTKRSADKITQAIGPYEDLDPDYGQEAHAN